MTRKQKLIDRFRALPRDLHFDELCTLLAYFGFYMEKGGKSGGSRVSFKHADGRRIILHKPHPEAIMKVYQLKQIKKYLGL